MGTVKLSAALTELMPVQNSSANIQSCDVIGNKNDTSEGTSIMALLKEFQRHLHNYESWFGKADTPSGETHIADRLVTNPAPYQIDAGNDDWGAWVQVLGSNDTPARIGKTLFDLHRFIVTAVERGSSDHFIQIAFGTSGAAALVADTITEFVYRPQSGTLDEGINNIMSPRCPAGTKVWIRVLVKGQNTGTVDFFLGLHEYL